MIKLPFPMDENGNPFDAGVVFQTCVSMVANGALRARLNSIRHHVEAEATNYNQKASTQDLFQNITHDKIGRVSGSEMVKVYTQRMVPKAAVGRPIYDKIMSAPAYGRCPFCGIGTVNTLDHYLPKSLFPVFSVTPNNLIPACRWCQKEKGDYYGTNKSNQLIHPYFDDLNDDIWLKAEVKIGNPAAFRYFSAPPAHWPSWVRDRVQTHLNTLNLSILYSSNAGSRLSEIRGRLRNLHQKGGADVVRAHLKEELASLEEEYLNSWVSAMYRAAIASNWFCDGGFL